LEPGSDPIRYPIGEGLQLGVHDLVEVLEVIEQSVQLGGVQGIQAARGVLQREA
jgi:hypothetical protein